MSPLTSSRRALVLALSAGGALLLYLLTLVPSFPPWLGFNGKTLWDLLSLVVVPLSLAGVTYLFNRLQGESERSAAQKQRALEEDLARRQREAEQAIARQREAETALQAYLDKMTDLLLKEKLRTSWASSEVRSIALARTRTVLQTLDGRRKGHLVRFLYESRLLQLAHPVLSLKGADLREAVLEGAVLPAINLGGADLREAVLEGADLAGASLAGADLRGARMRAIGLKGVDLGAADLRGAILVAAVLVDADLRGAKLHGADLQAATLRQATLDGVDLSGAMLEGAER